MAADDLLARADAIAVEAHEGQTDKAGVAYIGHPRRVARRVRGAGGTVAAQAVALLHDVLEDSSFTADDLRARAIPEDVVAGVQAMTKPDGASYPEAIERAAADPLAALVKRCDLADNADPDRLAALDPDTREELRARYATGLARLDALTGGTSTG